MPRAKAVKLTVRLLVMMALEAAGAMELTERVHILWRWMVASICGPSM